MAGKYACPVESGKALHTPAMGAGMRFLLFSQKAGFQRYHQGSESAGELLKETS
jgi:hypothetical protein